VTDPTVRDDRAIVRSVVTGPDGTDGGRWFQFASDAVKADGEFILEIAKHSVLKLEPVVQVIAPGLWADRRFVLGFFEAITTNVHCMDGSVDLKKWFALVDSTLLASREIALQLLHFRGAYFNYVSEALRGDRELVLLALNKKDAQDVQFSRVGEVLRADREIAALAVARTTYNFKYVAESLRGDRAFVLSVVERPGEGDKL